MKCIENIYGLTAVILILLGLTGCASIKIDTAYDKQTDFSGFKSYQWIPEIEGSGVSPRINNSLIKPEVRGTADRILADRGYQRKSRA